MCPKSLNLPGLIISLWGGESKGELRGLGERQRTGQLSCAIILSCLSARSCFVPLMTDAARTGLQVSLGQLGSDWIAQGLTLGHSLIPAAEHCNRLMEP